jgi:5-methylcytosine-specific restriction endonuclease McrA
VSQVSRILNGQNKDAILARIRGKSQREVEVVLAEFQPSITMPRDVVRPIMVRVPAVQDGGQSTAMAEKSTGQESAPVDACEKSAYCRSGSASVPQADPPAPGATGPAGFERRALIQFSASGAFMAKLEQIRSLAWHRLSANASLEQVFELLMDRFIEREDPSVRHERRDKQACQVPVSECETTPPAVLQKMPLRTDSTNRARYIPARVRDQVFARDRCQCTYTGTNGRRCASTRALQIDHVQPVARGGSCEANNLRLLCAYHNRLEAERLMGRHGGREGPRMR